ncbi:ATP-binding cassette domain-containing protein [Mycoplasma sp. 1654_15]|uniref:ATP-binding cassette domain-containing protein n=1 Tax=Mycoplasma sp. 1654_15 TaxID=2725994 RepID=UPI00144961D3|nr:ABC transporter ATP-binding protein [Mycoplasma sp. 1654_15]QJB71241.1 ABC transporter ATP-binding protein [Mycoplasma sp. 1654_15]
MKSSFLKNIKDGSKILLFEKKLHFSLFLVKNINIAIWSLHFYSYNFIINYFLNKNDNFNVFIAWLVVGIMTVILAIILNWVSNILVVNIRTNTYAKLQEKIILNLSQKSYSYIIANRSETISLLKNNTETSMTLLTLFMFNIYEAFGNFFITIIFMLAISYWSGIFILTLLIARLIILVVIYKCSPYLQKKIDILLEEYKISNQKEFKHYTVFYLYYFFNKIDLFKKIILKKLSNFYSFFFKNNLQTDWFDSLGNTLDFSAIAISIIELVVLIYYQYIEIGVLFAFITYITRISYSFTHISNSVVAFRVYTPVLNEILENAGSQTNLMSFKENILSIELVNINFKYNEESFIFKDKSLKIEKNKKYAILGDSGSGKSTLLKIISGLVTDYEGQILLNNKYELKSMIANDIREKIGFIDNKNVIFEDTLLNNIVLWDSKPDLAKVENLMQQFKIKNIDLNTQINKQSLSEGEKQRISLARVFYQDFEIICLDEALDNIEKNFSNQIWDYILKTNNKTIIAISHHFDQNQLNKFDNVIQVKG